MKKLTLFVVAVCALALSACFKSPEAEWREAHPGLCTTEEVSDEAAKAMLLECLKERWGVDFEIVSFGRSNGDACQYEFDVQPIGTDDTSRGYASIVTDPKYLDSDAFIYQKDDKFFGEADRYFYYIAREDIEKYFSDLIKGVYPENKIYYNGEQPYVYAGFDKDSTFQDFLESDAGHDIHLHLFIPYTGKTKKDEREHINQVRDILKKTGHMGVLGVDCLKDDGEGGYSYIKRKEGGAEFKLSMVVWRTVDTYE
jgi:hypothetical protein